MVAILVCMMGTSLVKAQEELQGANAVFEFITESIKKAEATDKKDGAEQEGSMKEQIKSLQKKWDVYYNKREDLSAEASVTEWLDIFDLYTEASLNAKRMDWSVWKRERGKAYSVVGDLPDTATWGQWLDDLQERSEKFKAKSPAHAVYTSFLVEFLKGDKERAWKQWNEFSKILRKKEVGDDDYEAKQLVASLDYFEENIAGSLKIDDYKLTKFERVLGKLENTEDGDSKSVLA